MNAAAVSELYLAALLVFLVAAGTDWIDGWWARTYHQITKLGRVFDPFVDKVIICGTYIILAAEQLKAEQAWFGIASWMAVVVVAREMLVTALRSAIEQGGGDFSAKWSGKWKMVLQCGAVALSLWRLWFYQFNANQMRWTDQPSALSTWTLRLLVWGAVIMTIYSGWVYVRRALDLLRP